VTATRATLVPHPDTPCDVVAGLGAHATLTASGRLQLHYVLRAPLERLAIPAPGVQRFRDGLWRHTCFEAFVGADGAAGYRELNVAPSREWAAYAFAKYREGMTRLDRQVPAIDVRRDEGRLEVSVGVELAEWFDPPWRNLRLGLAAVIETADGATSYWAIRHPAERPDFHHRGGFALTLS
jgi:hypothetical protein